MIKDKLTLGHIVGLQALTQSSKYEQFTDY